jgi:hypothetical protein
MTEYNAAEDRNKPDSTIRKDVLYFCHQCIKMGLKDLYFGNIIVNCPQQMKLESLGLPCLNPKGHVLSPSTQPAPAEYR